MKNLAAREYAVKKRRLNRQTIGNFIIGYAPDQGDALTKALEKRGFLRRELADVGLVNRFGGDLFRGRMMVALSDGSGEIVGFTGRIIHDDPRAPKYLNTPQTLLFDKSCHIFGLYQAKEAIRKSDAAIIIEGNLDVVSSHAMFLARLTATSATCACAASQNHPQHFKRFDTQKDNIILLS